MIVIGDAKETRNTEDLDQGPAPILLMIATIGALQEDHSLTTTAVQLFFKTIRSLHQITKALRLPAQRIWALICQFMALA